MPQHPLSRLDSDGQEYVSACCRDFRSFLPRHDSHLLEEQIEAAPSEARFALLCELLPIEIEHVKFRTGRLLTLHELCHAHPRLKEYLPKAYAWVPAELRLPDVLGRFKVLKVLGEGGQGCVVQARDELDDRLVALKYATHTANVSLLRREQKFLAELAHKNIIDVLGAGNELGIYYLVLPLRRGESLQVVYGQHRAGPMLAAELILQIARAISHMHAHNVVHRDIKPGNIHLDPKSPVETVILLDLGMAVDVAAWNVEDRRILEHGGTKAYMAPEQIASDETSDPKLSDVFALGAVLYFLLVGEPPLDRAAAPEILRRTKAPRRLKRICRQAIENRAALRQPSAATFADQIEQFLISHSTHRVLKRLAVPLAPALLVAIGATVWMGMIQSPPLNSLAGEELWVERTARELGIDLNAITSEDFEVAFEPIEYSVGDNTLLPNARTNVRIAVAAKYPLDELMGEVEYRIGNCPWRNLVEGRIDGRSCNQLERREVDADGPVQLRIDSLRDSGTGKVWGPYYYEMSIRKTLLRRKAAIGGEAGADWNVRGSEWYKETDVGWELLPNNKYLDIQYLNAIQLGEYPDNLRVTIPFEANERNAQVSAIETFRNFSNGFAHLDAIYMRLAFSDGTFSTVRELRRTKKVSSNELPQ